MTEQEKNEDTNLLDVALRDAHNAANRRHWLFIGISIFLVVDAIAFFVALFWASWSVSNGKDWHVYASALLPGALGAIIAVMALKAVYRVPQNGGSDLDDLSPGLGNVKDMTRELSGD